MAESHLKQILRAYVIEQWPIEKVVRTSPSELFRAGASHRWYALLAGPPINGRAPSGEAVVTSLRNGYIELAVEVMNVNVEDDILEVRLNGALEPPLALRSGAGALKSPLWSQAHYGSRASSNNFL